MSSNMLFNYRHQIKAFPNCSLITFSAKFPSPLQLWQRYTGGTKTFSTSADSVGEVLFLPVFKIIAVSKKLDARRQTSVFAELQNFSDLYFEKEASD